MTYETSFDRGERQAFADRMVCMRRPRPLCPQGEDERGFWDGYCPRDSSWWRRPSEEAQMRDQQRRAA